MNVEPIGFADALHGRYEGEKGVKDGFRAFTSSWVILFNWGSRIAEGADLGYKGEESRVLWPNILEKDKELTCNQNEFVLIYTNNR